MRALSHGEAVEKQTPRTPGKDASCRQAGNKNHMFFFWISEDLWYLSGFVFFLNGWNSVIPSPRKETPTLVPNPAFTVLRAPEVPLGRAAPPSRWLPCPWLTRAPAATSWDHYTFGRLDPGSAQPLGPRACEGVAPAAALPPSVTGHRDPTSGTASPRPGLALTSRCPPERSSGLVGPRQSHTGHPALHR